MSRNHAKVGVELEPVVPRPGRRRLQQRITKLGAGLLTCLLLGSFATLQAPASAHAETVYEIEGGWGEGTSNEVKTGDIVSTTWNYNVNDDSPAPSNDPVENVTLTFTAQHAIFTALPSVCFTEGVSPASEISSDGTVMTCNLGSRDQGSAELVITGLEVRAQDGENVTVDGSVGNVSANLPPLVVKNAFAMDLKFNGTVSSWASSNGAYQEFYLPWSLQHAPNGPAGPSSVTYDLRLTPSNGEDVQMFGTNGCAPLDRIFSGYPRSDAAAPAEQLAAFPTCTLTRVSKNNFKLTLSGLNYAAATLPSKDGSGVDLPTEWNVIASGMLKLYFPYTNSGTMGATIGDYVYTATGSALTSVDNPANNSHSFNYTRGTHTGGWQPQTMQPRPNGSYWSDTFRQLAGGPVRQGVAIVPPSTAVANQVCTILDTRYVSFTKATIGKPSGTTGVITPDPGVAPSYFVGNSPFLNPASSSYNPNSFDCNTATGWVSTPPSDLSQVKVVRASIPQGNYEMTDRSMVMLYVDSTINGNVTDGQDIWEWNSVKYGNAAWMQNDRSMNAADKPAWGTATPNSRYPFTGAFRDVMRVIVAKPQIKKEVDTLETVPGATVNYTLRYRAEGATDISVPNYKVIDTLPAGLTYVAGSASVTPTSINGQKITWQFPTVNTNTDYVITFSARISGTAKPGDDFVNSATAAIGSLEAQGTATTKIKDSGLTLLTKTAETAKVPHTGGVAEDSWTVRITSADVKSQSFTDAIDVLPYNGDGRGTSFSGSYALRAPVEAVAGATVYYSTSDPATISMDPADTSNGVAGDPAGNTAGWTTAFTADATAVRVIGPALAPSAQQEFNIPVVTTGASHEDRYVNVAEARAERTKLIMRTSSAFEIAAVNSIALKKYVQDSSGEWRDAQNVDDYPSFFVGDTVTYRLVVTNTGDETLTNVQITDDKVDLAGLSPLPAGLRDGAVIDELLPGADNAKMIEYTVTLTKVHADQNVLVNTACAAPENLDIDASCDPAGLTVEESSLSWLKIAAGAEENYLAGSEWELIAVDADKQPMGDAVVVIDCIGQDAAECDGADKDPAAGKFRVNELKAGAYRLTETRAPAGYQLDDTPRYIEVRGDVQFAAPIENVQSAVPSLPLTGGLGTLGIFLGAGGLGVLVLFGLALQRRRVTTSAI